jgi:hypothetical protein
LAKLAFRVYVSEGVTSNLIAFGADSVPWLRKGKGASGRDINI